MNTVNNWALGCILSEGLLLPQIGKSAVMLGVTSLVGVFAISFLKDMLRIELGVTPGSELRPIKGAVLEQTCHLPGQKSESRKIGINRLQALVRGYLPRKTFANIKIAITHLQALVRGHLLRQYFFNIKTVAKNGLALKDVSAAIQGDRKVVLTALAQNGLALQFASCNLQKDEDMVRTAMDENELALEFASQEYQKSEIQRRAPCLALLKEELNALAQNKPIGWQEKSAKLLRKARQGPGTLELQRLLDWGVIDQSIERRLERMVHGYYDSGSEDLLKRLSSKAMIGRALEMQKLYKDTHWVFIHAQSSPWIVIGDLIKESIKCCHPEKNLHQFKYLRMPKDESVAGDISIYKQSSTYDHDTQTRQDLISADGYLYNTTHAESAFSFMNRNTNMTPADSAVALSIIQRFYPSLNPIQQQEFAERIITPIRKPRLAIANLFVLCIPKDKSAKIEYRSHPFGKICDCHPLIASDQLLDRLQNGDLAKCKNGSTPQYRIYTPELHKQEGVKSFLISPDVKYRKEQKQSIKSIVQEMALLSKVSAEAL